ncbi:MAG: response regulator transcription factor [Bacteroidales bacterium]|nr:response regulator transcription factor [Bacteroidales bacterium]
MQKIIIADDHKIIADGIKSMLAEVPDIEVIATVYNGIQVLEILGKISVDLILLDIDMPEMNGIDCAREVLKNYPDTKITILTMHYERALIKNFIEMGVHGYLLKTVPKEEFIHAINVILHGGEYFNADITRALLHEEKLKQSTFGLHPSLSLLSAREIEIIKLIASGMTNSQIGEKLFISPRTADVHRTNIMKKIDVHNVAGLIRFAFQNKLTE